MNDGNLIPNSARTPSELRAMTRKGGQKSGEVRRRNRDIKKIVAAFMQAVPDEQTAERLRAQGIDERDITNKSAMVYALCESALKGDVKAFETLMKYSGEDPEQQRKDTELQMKRDAHILILSDKESDYLGLNFTNGFLADEEKKAVLIAVQDKYKEITDVRKQYESCQDDEYFDDDYSDDEDSETD